jgi:hypothetical protein
MKCHTQWDGEDVIGDNIGGGAEQLFSWQCPNLYRKVATPQGNNENVDHQDNTAAYP